jgi:glycosyltransferase involved in cell wall biosynthesis
MEAMASGCFPIVTNLPGNKSFIKDGVNGILVENSSANSLVEKLMYLKKVNLKDSSVANRLVVEKDMNREVNMRLFFKAYQALLLRKK